MEIYIATVSGPKDRDLILGLCDGTIKLTYSEETARGSNLRFGRKGLLQAGQLIMGGTRVTFKPKGISTGMNSNPRYGWMPHNASFGFLDRPPATLGQIHF